ncbi:hypothetical protein DPMN_115502 [Dreissena polymorpha]|uniref:Uncharacterized protein n=1 Tax=Dreissena polymorpha TaxID=45954 RepID=A0A9D4KM61_DREPO|nr:hypothetical protein DPMN_115502 [Dreissena polymorpha]
MSYCHRPMDEALGRDRWKYKPCLTTDIMDLCYQRRELSHEKYTSIDSRTYS